MSFRDRIRTCDLAARLGTLALPSELQGKKLVTNQQYILNVLFLHQLFQNLVCPHRCQVRRGRLYNRGSVGAGVPN